MHRRTVNLPCWGNVWVEDRWMAQPLCEGTSQSDERRWTLTLAVRYVTHRSEFRCELMRHANSNQLTIETGVKSKQRMPLRTIQVLQLTDLSPALDRYVVETSNGMSYAAQNHTALMQLSGGKLHRHDEQAPTADKMSLSKRHSRK